MFAALNNNDLYTLPSSAVASNSRRSLSYTDTARVIILHKRCTIYLYIYRKSTDPGGRIHRYRYANSRDDLTHTRA